MPLLGQGFERYALAEHAHLPGQVHGGGEVVGLAQQQLHGQHVAQRQQGDQ